MPKNTNKSVRKNILLISYHFPPTTAVGGLRIASFAKNLPLFGWNSYVLTIKDRYLERIDRERLKAVEHIKIYKTVQLPTILNVYLKLKVIWHSFLRKKRVTLDELTSSYVQPKLNDPATEKIWQKLKRYFISLFLTLPDLERKWILPAVFRAIREIRREKIDYILTTCPPYSVHLIGLLVKTITGVRWVADFRDPWMNTGVKRLYATSTLSNKIEEWMEQKVVKNADMILVTNDTLCKAFRESYDKQPENKFLCIINGFDTGILSKFEHLRKYQKFTLTYTGTLYLGRSPEPVFQALKELKEEGILNLHGICLKLVGNCGYIDGCLTSQVVSTYGLDSVVEILDYVPYSKALEIIKKSHIALLLAPDQPFQIPAKVYDYIGLGTQILALAEDGATSDLINSTKAGTVLSPTNIEGIKEFIYNSITNQESLQTGIDSNIARKFDKKLIAHNLAKYLSSIL